MNINTHTHTYICIFLLYSLHKTTTYRIQPLVHVDTLLHISCVSLMV